MDFDSVMREITGGLTNDPTHDIPYLQEQMDAYKGSEYEREIQRSCSRLIFKLIPDEVKEKFGKAVQHDFDGYEAALEEVDFNIYKKNYAKALEIVEGVVQKIESAPMYKDGADGVYFAFEEEFEEVLYNCLADPQVPVRPAPKFFVKAYFLYGNLLLELKRYEDAERALQKVLKWNPMCERARLEYIEILKVTGRLEEYFAATLDAFKCMYHRDTLAHCFRNLAYYFVEKQLYTEAFAALRLSLTYENGSKIAQSEMYYIMSETNGEVNGCSDEELLAASEEYHFPTGPDEDVVGIAFTFGKKLMEAGSKGHPRAKYFLNIGYELTRHPDFKELLDQCEEQS